MSETHPFELSVGARDSLFGVVHASPSPGPRPTVVICHGFKGFMEWGFFPYLAELLAERGFTAIRFNFRGSGMRPGDDLVTDLEAFRTATFSRDTEDLELVLAALGDSVANGLVDRDRLGLFGHSRGGGTALLGAALSDWRDRIGALVTWAAVSSFDRQGDAEKLAWRQRGSIEITNARTGQVLEIDSLVLDDLMERRESLDLLAAAGDRQAPWLLVHGEDDETVPVGEANDLAEAAAGKGRLIEIGGANHTFGAIHPFAGPTPQLIAAMNATQGWFREHLPSR